MKEFHASNNVSEPSEDLFNMWRAVIIMAHADNIVQPEEREYLERIIGNIFARGSISKEHLQVLLSDINHSQNISDIIPQIKERKYIGRIVYFARLLAWKDNVLDPSEEYLLKKIEASVKEGINFEKVKSEVKQEVKSNMKEHREHMEATVGSITLERGLTQIIDIFSDFF